MSGRPGKLDRDRAALVVVDVQDGFAKALEHFDAIAESSATLVTGVAAMGIPVHVTEQYPKGRGHTDGRVTDALPEGAEVTEKVCFSAVQAEGFGLGERDQALVCGIETHVCVNQTVLDLLDAGVEVHVAQDATGSRTTENWRLGLDKLEKAGAVRTSIETALFELLGRAGTDEFKTVQGLIK
ncbi:MAG: isochorismatase family protein [Solirubrobacterales bacterium]